MLCRLSCLGRGTVRQISHSDRSLEIIETTLKASVHGTEDLSYLSRGKMFFCCESVNCLPGVEQLSWLFASKSPWVELD